MNFLITLLIMGGSASVVAMQPIPCEGYLKIIPKDIVGEIEKKMGDEAIANQILSIINGQNILPRAMQEIKAQKLDTFDPHWTGRMLYEKFIIEIYNDPSFAPLFLAIYLRQPGIVKEVLKTGVDVKKSTNNGTPLQFAASISYDNINTGLSIIKQLIDAGANVNASNGENLTPIEWAKNEEIVQLLAKNGARIPASSEILFDLIPGQRTRSRNPNPTQAPDHDRIAALIDAGADPNMKNKSGETPLLLGLKSAVRFDIDYLPVIKMLLAKGAKIDPQIIDFVAQATFRIKNNELKAILLPTRPISPIPSSLPSATDGAEVID